MDLQASIEQVAGILVREGLRFQVHDDGDHYRLLFEPDAVFIHFEQRGDAVRIFLTSPALQRLDPEDPGYALVLNRLNELNRRHGFVKWIVDDGTLMAVHDLLGDHLQAGELLNALGAMTTAVQEAVKELADEVGGERYAEAVARELEEIEDE
jgi:hypothetical protein